MIDLRSDTVTKPTPAMRRAMAEAEVGDDVYGEDPTVRRLEERVAEILGKPASLFLPSGTMGNTIGIKLHTRHGEEVVCDHRAHILDWEMSMTAWFSGCLARPVPTEDGVLRWSDIEPVVRARTGFPAPTAMVNIEHPHNMGGGTLFPIEGIEMICDRAHERALKVHMDGARLFNAVAASGLSAARIVAKTDTVMFCLSKGLGAPVGSMLAGDLSSVVSAIVGDDHDLVRRPCLSPERLQRGCDRHHEPHERGHDLHRRVARRVDRPAEQVPEALEGDRDREHR